MSPNCHHHRIRTHRQSVSDTVSETAKGIEIEFPNRGMYRTEWELESKSKSELESGPEIRLSAYPYSPLLTPTLRIRVREWLVASQPWCVLVLVIVPVGQISLSRITVPLFLLFFFSIFHFLSEFFFVLYWRIVPSVP